MEKREPVGEEGREKCRDRVLKLSSEWKEKKSETGVKEYRKEHSMILGELRIEMVAGTEHS